MADYAISLSRSATKELDALDGVVLQRVFPKIEALKHSPRPSGCRKLTGGNNLWRIRAGDYRIVYSIDDVRRIVDIAAVRHRSEVYR